MTLRNKLILAQFPWAVALIMLGWFAMKNMTELEEHFINLLQVNYRSITASQGMKDSLERMDSATLLALVGNKEKGVQMARDHGRVFEQALKMANHHVENQEARQAVKQTESQWLHFRGQVDDFFDPEKNLGNKEDYFNSIYPSFLAVKESVDRVMTLNQGSMSNKIDRIPVMNERIKEWMQLAILAALLASVVATMALQGYMLAGIRILSQAARRLGEGDIMARANVTGEDEIAQLANDFNNMANSLWEYRLTSVGESLRLKNISQAAMDAFPGPVLVFDGKGQLTNWNRVAEEELEGLQIGTTLRKISAGEEEAVPSWWPIVAQPLGHILTSKKKYSPAQGEEAGTLHTEQGETHIRVHGNPLFIEPDTFGGAVMVLQDVTYCTRMEQIQRDMLATAAHEFRTPLTSLQLSIHLCLTEIAGPINEQQADLLVTANGDCQRLDTLVNDLLNLSRLHTGKLALVKAPVVVENLLNKAMEEHLDSALDKGVYLKVEKVEPANMVLNADGERLLHVLNNLIGNAIRHTELGGGVILSAHLEGDSVMFQVSDSGQGILPEFQDKVFERFFQIPDQEGGNSGLGLSIAREMVELHGGRIGLESTPGKGSLFWFALPLEGRGER